MVLDLKLRTQLDIPLEAGIISPDRLAGLTESEIARVPLIHGNRKKSLGDFFDISGTCDGEIRLVGDFTKVKSVGSGMTGGRIIIEGNSGMHLGCAMSGGEIAVEGDAGDWTGAEMSGGRIVIKGNAGHMVGGAYRGGHMGLQGGEIIVHGNTGNEAGNSMRNGLIVIMGNSGDFTGANMFSGTIIVFGELGIRTGASMKRGSIISMRHADLLPTFTYSCFYHPSFLRLYLRRLRDMGISIDDAQIEGGYHRWCGDSMELNRGEVLLFSGSPGS